MAIARPTTSSVATTLRAKLATTCPTSTAPPRIGIVRKRSMTPPTLSAQTPTAVPAAPNIAHSTTIPGTTSSRYPPLRSIAPPNT